MNKNKKPMNSKLRKKMEKEIRVSRTGKISAEVDQYGDKRTEKEWKAAHPRSPAKMRDQMRQIKKTLAIKKKQRKKILSKRTTPGTVPSDSTPAITHVEGGRWIKTLTKQNLAQRAIQQRQSRKK